MTNFSCVDYDDKGRAFTGGANGQIYVWIGNSISKTLNAHKGVVHSIRCVDGMILSGGSDKKLVIHDSGLSKLKELQLGSCPRGIDYMNN